MKFMLYVLCGNRFLIIYLYGWVYGQRSYRIGGTLETHYQRVSTQNLQTRSHVKTVKKCLVNGIDFFVCTF